ncbi:MAG: hypothetical protein R3232_11355, partial [Clostridia bacterium]|nr:hypothetical protein [Clostridia bacterium]
MGILYFPDELGESGYISDTPDRHQFRYSFNGEERSIFWADSSTISKKEELHTKQLKFLEFVNFIKEIVYNSEEFKSLPEREGGYR